MPSVLGDELLRQLKEGVSGRFLRELCERLVTRWGFLVLEIFVPGLANWVTGFGRLGRFVECARLTLRRL